MSCKKRMEYDLFNQPIIPEFDILRIPYMGSKNKICIDLFRKMLEIKPNAKYFVDLFGGGGSMSFTALQIGLQVVYNEKQTSLVDFIKYIVDRVKKGHKGQFGLFPDDFYKFINKEEFNKLKGDNTVKSQFAKICYSFGNNQKSYLFGDIESLKHLGHDIVIFKCEDSLKELNKLLGTRIKLSKAHTWSGRRLDFMNQVKNRRYHELEQLEQLEQLQRLQLLNLDFKDVVINTSINETIVYLDPPYRGTEKYIEDVIHEEIDTYFSNSPYTCFMSEYKAPFKSVLEIEKLKLMNNSQATKSITIEKLYINKP